MQWISDPQIWISLLTLTALEIILGIDNIVIISILTGKLPRARQGRARTIGISLALITRLLLLFGLVWLAGLTEPLFTVFDNAISVRDLIMLGGGLFLIVKGTREVHEVMEPEAQGQEHLKVRATFAAIIAQIILMDIVFSLDSVITAIGMARQLGVMAAAVIIAVGIMLVASGRISEYIHRHPSLKMLALSFLMMVGVTLVAEGLEFHIPKGYIYFAMGFSGAVETLNLMAGNRRRERRGNA